jgi:predicted DNA binding protein
LPVAVPPRAVKAARLLVRPAGGAFPGVDTTLAEASEVRREQLLNLEWLSDGTYALLYRLTGDPDAVRDLLADHRDVIEADVVSGAERAGTDPVYVFVHTEERPSLSALLAIAEDHALLMDPPFAVTDEGIAITVAGDAGALRSAFAEAREAVPIEVVWSGGYEPGADAPLARLTGRQREALEAATDLGFYERPRETDYEELGEVLECAPSTANELLRRAEASLVTTVLDR